MVDIIEIINGGGWADWVLNKLEIDFEAIKIALADNRGKIIEFVCKDYIGYSFIGHWDESVIEDIRVEGKGNLINDSIQTIKKLYGEDPLPGGGVKLITDIYHQINIKLIDGNLLRVACRNIEFEGIDSFIS